VVRRQGHYVLQSSDEVITCHAERYVIVFVVPADVAEHVTEVLGAMHAGKAEPRRYVVYDVDTLTAQLGRSLRPEVDQVRGHVARKTGYGAVEFQRISGGDESITWSYLNV